MVYHVCLLGIATVKPLWVTSLFIRNKCRWSQCRWFRPVMWKIFTHSKGLNQCNHLLLWTKDRFYPDGDLNLCYGTWRYQSKVCIGHVYLCCICLHSSSKVDMKLRRSVKGTAPQEEWHNTCVHALTHTHTHKYTSSPSFSSLSSMTHPTQGQRASEGEGEWGRRERRRMGECAARHNGGEAKKLDSQRRHMARSFFFLLTFYFNAMLIRLCVLL